MAAMNLPTPIGLLDEKGVIGHLLRQLHRSSNTVLEEAEAQTEPWSWLARWVQKNPVIHWYAGSTAMRDSECAALKKEGFKETANGVYTAATRARHNANLYQGVREVRFACQKANPTKIIMRVEMDGCWPDGFRKAFEAAASQKRAFNALLQVARKGGSVSSHDRHLKILAAEKCGDTKTSSRLTQKHLSSILQTKPGRLWLLENKAKALCSPPKMQQWARQNYEQFYAADVRRLGKNKADDKWKGTEAPRFKMNCNGDYVAAALTKEWLTIGQNGFPGFCFMSDALLSQLLGRALPWPRLLEEEIHGWKTIRTVRERLGLKKADILLTGMEKVSHNKWAILNRHGQREYSITLLPNKPLPPEL